MNETALVTSWALCWQVKVEAQSAGSLPYNSSLASGRGGGCAQMAIGGVEPSHQGMTDEKCRWLDSAALRCAQDFSPPIIALSEC